MPKLVAMTMAKLTFYFAPGASSMAPHIALHEVAADFDARPVSFANKQTRTDAFLRLNTAGQVPVLFIDDEPLTEVAAILFYLAKRFPDAGLWPGDLLAQAQAMSWMSLVASTVHGAWSALGSELQQGHAPGSDTWQLADDRVRTAFGVADRKLGDAMFAVGRYSIADIHLFRLYFRFRHTLHPSPGEFPHLEAHYQRMLERPAVQRTCDAEAAVGYEIVGFTAPSFPWRA